MSRFVCGYSVVSKSVVRSVFVSRFVCGYSVVLKSAVRSVFVSRFVCGYSVVSKSVVRSVFTSRFVCGYSVVLISVVRSVFVSRLCVGKVCVAGLQTGPRCSLPERTLCSAVVWGTRSISCNVPVLPGAPSPALHNSEWPASLQIGMQSHFSSPLLLSLRPPPLPLPSPLSPPPPTYLCPPPAFSLSLSIIIYKAQNPVRRAPNPKRFLVCRLDTGQL